MGNEIEHQTLEQLQHKSRRRAGKKSGSSIPYADATSGEKARAEAIKILRRLGCEEIGFMDKFETHELLLYFKHRGREVHLTASAKGWAQAWLKKNPYSYRMRRTERDYQNDALHQGHIAINSMLRDAVKGNVSLIECGVLSFEAVFMPFMVTDSGRPVIEQVQHLLPKPDDQKVVSLPKPAA